MAKKGIRNIALLIAASVVVAAATYLVNVRFLASTTHISTADMMFLEGMIFILTGALLFIGSGGISRTTARAAVLASAAKTFDEDVIGPSEIFRRDVWKPKGFTRLGLILIITGIILLLMYFLSI